MLEQASEKMDCVASGAMHLGVCRKRDGPHGCEAVAEWPVPFSQQQGLDGSRGIERRETIFRSVFIRGPANYLA